MNRNLFLIAVFLLCCLFSSKGQPTTKDAEGYPSFQMPDGDTVYTMKIYYMVFLKEGENRNQDPKEAAEIQQKHLAHIDWMADEGYVIMAGPFADEGDVRGILVFNAKNKEKVEELANMDPAVKAGRLEVEIHPWWAAKGSKLK
jgi:uncharacterized protein YciI